MKAARAHEQALTDSLELARDSLHTLTSIADSTLRRDSVLDARADSLGNVANEASERHSTALSRLRRVNRRLATSDSLAALSDSLFDEVQREHQQALSAATERGDVNEARADSLKAVLLGVRDAALAFELRADSLLAAKDRTIELLQRPKGFRILGFDVEAPVVFGGCGLGTKGADCMVGVGVSISR